MAIFILIVQLPNIDSIEFSLSENDIEWCEEIYPQFETLGLDWFLENYHYTIEARVCASLYRDVIWDYVGSDRIEKLLERSEIYLKLEIKESEEEAITGIDDPTPAKIPTWIKDVAEFWINDLIDDKGFVQVIEWLVQNNIIEIPYAEHPEAGTSISIPSWIKTSAGFWIDNKITDVEFAIGLEWLINNGIIRV